MVLMGFSTELIQNAPIPARLGIRHRELIQYRSSFSIGPAARLISKNAFPA
jgi:hypothetical protein